MATYLTTLSTHQDKKSAQKAEAAHAAFLTKQGRGKTHFVKIRVTKGIYRVDLFER